MKLIIPVLSLFLFAQYANAHSPSAIKASAAAGTLTIEILHSVSNPEKHFIDDTYISLNGKKIINQTFNSQKSDKLQYAQYFIPGLKKNDKIKITADCNKGGSLTTEITIP